MQILAEVFKTAVIMKVCRTGACLLIWGSSQNAGINPEWPVPSPNSPIVTTPNTSTMII